MDREVCLWNNPLGPMSLYTLLLRPLLFRLPPEGAQRLAGWALKRRLLWQATPYLRQRPDPRLRVKAGGLEFASPVGLAAGFDKECGLLPTLTRLGFGYVIGGTVLPQARPGNLKPRLLRLVRQESLVNALGFPSHGLAAVRRELERAAPHRDTPLVVSVAGLTPEEFVWCHGQVEPLADAVELNISSPNTAGLQVFQEPESFAPLVDRINETRRKPLWVKLPRFQDEEGRERVLRLVRIAQDKGIDGLTAANTRPVEAPALAMGRGGLSGRALFPDTVGLVAEVRAEAGPAVAVHACGGISTGREVQEVLRAGASTVQLLTAFIYRGPGIAAEINRELVRLMEEKGVDSLGHLGTS